VRRIQPDIIITVRISVSFMYRTGYCGQIVMELEYARQIFEKYSDMKFHENPSSGSRVVPCGQTDMVKLILVFRNFTNLL